MTQSTDNTERLLTELTSKLDNIGKDIKQELSSIDKKFEKIDDRLNKLEVGQAELKGEIKNIKTDSSWIKWLFGILGSMVVLLLSIILTVTFKLLGN